MRILLVEDHHDTLEVMTLLLAHYHHDITPASTLADAERLCRNARFDLFICDIGLPDGDGWKMARIAREHGCPAIAVTAYGMPDDIEKARSAGFVAHILKPFEVDQLLSAIARVLPARSGAMQEVPQESHHQPYA